MAGSNSTFSVRPSRVHPLNRKNLPINILQFLRPILNIIGYTKLHNVQCVPIKLTMKVINCTKRLQSQLRPHKIVMNSISV